METRLRYETELIDKIKVIPDYLIPDVIQFIDNLALKKKRNSNKSNKSKIMEFAGDWEDFDDVDGFMDEIKSRRANGFNLCDTLV